MPAGRLRALARAFRLTIAAGLVCAFLPSVQTANAAETEVRLNIAASSAIISPGLGFTVSAEAENSSSFPVEAGTIALATSTGPLASAGAVESWIAGEGSAGPDVVVTNTLPLPANGTTATKLSIPAGVVNAEGVWGLEVQLRIGGGRFTQRTALAVRSQTTPASVATLFALSAPSPSDGLYSREALEELFAAGSDLQAALNAVAGQPISVGIDPRIIASIRVLGSDAPADATAWLRRLESAGLDTFALQYGDADPVGQIRAGYPTLLTPGFADVTSDPTVAATFTDWSYSRSFLWPRGDVLSADDLATFALTNGAPVIASSDIVGDASQPLVRVGGSTVVVAQSGPSAALGRALSATKSVEWQNASNVLQAELTFFGGQTIVLAPDRTVISDALRAAATLTTLAQSNVSRAVPIGSLSPAGSTSLKPTSLPDLLSSQYDHVRERTTQLESFATVSTQPAAVLDPVIRMTLATFAVGLSDADDTRARAIAAIDATVATLLDSVRLATSSSINVLSSEASLPFTVENDLDAPISVRVGVAPSNGRLLVADSVLTEVPANSRQTVRVPVKAKVGTGSVALTVTVVDTRGATVTAPVIVQANVQADSEGWGAVAFGSIAISLLLVGVIRQVRRARMARFAQQEASDGNE
ncbi:MAG TPA: DUF6049 family protein [Microbacteriaceae bacterium]|nr:DUF6049 family protein [Microbacteriaceae bacterium]